MELIEFVERYREIVAELRYRIGADVCDDLLVYLDTGEEGVAVEFLIGNLTRRRIPVTRREATALADLMTFFVAPAGRRNEPDSFYATLDDPAGALAELTVVDESS